MYFCNKMIQIIDKQLGGWRVVINGVDCTFTAKPLCLYVGNNLYPQTPNCDNGLRWRVNRRWISYNQIKKAIKANKQLLN